MKALEFIVTDVLSRNERLVVPLYQRQYQWHDHKNYEGRTSAFWLDVIAKATEVLAGSVRFDHYMGALLLAPDVSQREFGATPVVHVVDGQQRLTTFLILLAAMREVAKEYDHDDLIKQINKHVFNELGRADTSSSLAHYKLTPTPVDRDVFFDILEKSCAEVREQHRYYYWGNKIPQNTTNRALRAYEYFLAQIREFILSGASDDSEIDIDEEQKQGSTTPDANEENAPLRLDALLKALVFHLKLIVITLGEDDDAQVIFETLNSKAQPLLVMDLVRNNIFHRAEAQYRYSGDAREQTELLYHKVWEPFDHGWWRENAPNARPARPRIDHFLANVLTAETGERITVRELYAEYRGWAMPNRQPRFNKVEDELAVLQRHVPAYETLEKRRDDDAAILWLGERPEKYRDGDAAIAWLGERLRMWQNTTAYPIAFQISGSAVDDETRRMIAKLIDSYLMRRILCDLTQKNLNQLFPRLAATLRNEGVSVAVVEKFFEGQTRDTTRFPSDAELRSGILEKPAYGRIPSRILSDLLWSLEISSRTQMTEATVRPADLWVEHVMPQNWHENWLLNGKSVSPGDYDEPGYNGRLNALQTLGNLTITTDRLNISMGNAAFHEKVDKLLEYSNLSLNRCIAEKTEWNEDTIQERGEALAKLAVRIWPSPARTMTP